MPRDGWEMEGDGRSEDQMVGWRRGGKDGLDTAALVLLMRRPLMQKLPLNVEFLGLFIGMSRSNAVRRRGPIRCDAD